MIHIGITLLAPYIAWVLGESVHASAVLACVAGGLHLRQSFSERCCPSHAHSSARRVGSAHLCPERRHLYPDRASTRGAARGDAVRELWAGAVYRGDPEFGRYRREVAVGAVGDHAATVVERGPAETRSHASVGQYFSHLLDRHAGIVTLAAALALPMTTATGAPFPFRAEIILISFVVILATLVVQGLSLPPLIRFLRVEEGRGLEDEERLAREHAATAALTRLDQLVGEDWLKVEHVERLRGQYGRLVERVVDSAAEEEMPRVSPPRPFSDCATRP